MTFVGRGGVVVAGDGILAVEDRVGVVVADGEELVTTLEDMVGVVVADSEVASVAVEDMVGVVVGGVPTVT